MARSRRWTKARCRVRRSFDYHGHELDQTGKFSTHVTGVRVVTGWSVLSRTWRKV
jgi:hypothetical protein